MRGGSSPARRTSPAAVGGHGGNSLRAGNFCQFNREARGAKGGAVRRRSPAPARLICSGEGEDIGCPFVPVNPGGRRHRPCPHPGPARGAGEKRPALAQNRSRRRLLPLFGRWRNATRYVAARTGASWIERRAAKVDEVDISRCQNVLKPTRFSHNSAYLSPYGAI